MKPWMLYFIVPKINRTGGYERQAITLSQALAKNASIRLDIITDTSLSLCEHLPGDIRARCRHFDSRTMIGLYRAFSKEFNPTGRQGPSIIHLHALYRFSAMALMAGLRHGLPTVMKVPTERDAEILFQSTRPAMQIFRTFLKRIDLFICPSRAVVDELRPHLRSANQAAYVPNAVDTEIFYPVAAADCRAQKRRLNIPFERVILFVGRHTARKGGDILLRAFAECQQSIPPGTGLVFVGDGDQQQAWHSLSRQLGLDQKVMFFGNHPTPEEFYHAADAFVLPSLYEGMPNTLLEAMACGLPCVASRIGGVTDILDEHFAEVYFPATNVSALAEKLPTLLSPEARHIGAAMRCHVETCFSVRVVSRQLIELYERVIENHRR